MPLKPRKVFVNLVQTLKQKILLKDENFFKNLFHPPSQMFSKTTLLLNIFLWEILVGITGPKKLQTMLLSR